MKTRLLALAALLPMSTFAAAGDGWRFAPALSDPGHKFAPTVAAVAGVMDLTEGDSDAYAGVELNFNCGLIQSPGNKIRSHLMVGQYDKDGVDITTVELSPRYTVDMGSGWSAGFGPGLGYVRSEIAGRTTSMAALQLVAGVNYRQGSFYAGADARYQDARDKTVGGAELQLDSWLVAVKAGVNF